MGGVFYDIGGTIVVVVLCIAALLLALAIVAQLARFGFWLYSKRR